MTINQQIIQTRYSTAGGIGIHRSVQEVSYAGSIDELRVKLDGQRGILLSSSFDYPGRYTQWDLGFVNPPIAITAYGRRVLIEALNPRGELLLPEIDRAINTSEGEAGTTVSARLDGTRIEYSVTASSQPFMEEARSRQPGVFSILRRIVAAFRSDEDRRLGLYGAFGYDLAFQFDEIRRRQKRRAETRDMVLYLPDELIVADHRVGRAYVHRYEFLCRGWVSRTENHLAKSSDPRLDRRETTGGLKRNGAHRAWSAPGTEVSSRCDHKPGEFAARVRKALEYFKRGDLFEVVPGQVFHEPCRDAPSEIFKRLKADNPAPYGALINLGEQEYLVAASPEMFVRVEGSRIETCPISGTIARGENAIADARQIRALLNSEKDEAELSMCTDVDRNDKARVCEPGSVQVIGRRQVELYSRLIHTVDHVEGTLLPEFDALDGFLAHAWAVTVTGAPKQAAIQFIEDNEKSPRLWYGGAMGCIGFDGNMNTGLTLRTMRIKNGVAEVRAGATLLQDSDPEAEEAETRLKASALLKAVRGEAFHSPNAQTSGHRQMGTPIKETLQALMVDHHDSFVHSLGSYFREHGVALQTMRPELARVRLGAPDQPELVILSPGPGKPEDFQVAETISLCIARNIPLFGVCLGLQGIVEYFGGTLSGLGRPMHGSASAVRHRGGALFVDMNETFSAGRYHSLYAEQVPDCLRVTARSEEGVVMAVEHRQLPILAVQFHPESILTLQHQAGHQLIRNVVNYVNSLKPGNRQSRNSNTADRAETDHQVISDPLCL